MTAPYPESIREHVQLLREAGHGYAEISKRTGISYGTIQRWFNPEADERSRQRSRQRKHERRKPCPECGKPIWYTSEKCASCARPPRKWSQETVIQAIKGWANTHNGEPPTVKDWMYSTEEHPGATTVYGTTGLFPSWNAALQQAGFTLTGHRASNPGPGRISWDTEQAKQLRQKGIPDTEIGRRMGVTAGAISQKLGPRGNIKPANRKKRSRQQRIDDLKNALQHQEEGSRVCDREAHQTKYRQKG